jgi:multicomponent Na+:H+ antiporter subunit C
MIENFNYIITLSIFLISLYAVISSHNLIKKLFAITLLQNSILIFFISMGKVQNAKTPYLKCFYFNDCPEIYTNPVPHILMLTAIVVGVATFSVGLAIIFLIKKNLGTIEENEIEKIEI